MVWKGGEGAWGWLGGARVGGALGIGRWSRLLQCGRSYNILNSLAMWLVQDKKTDPAVPPVEQL